jgi:hypothetical protein
MIKKLLGRPPSRRPLLPAMKCGDEEDVVAILELVIELALELPVDVVDEDEDTWPPVWPTSRLARYSNDAGRTPSRPERTGRRVKGREGGCAYER